jgi:hypothetical protein
MAELSKARVCGLSCTDIADSNPAWGADVCVLCVLYSKDKRRKTSTVKTQREHENKQILMGSL